MSYQSNWSNGGWITICDACGRKFKESELRQRWDGLMVCSGDWEVRQPQDYVRGVADIQAPPYVRPEQADVFLPYFFTQYPSEEIPVVETTAKNAIKTIGVLTTTAAVLNGNVLNGDLAINATSFDDYNPERALLSESILLILGRPLTDTLSTPTESLAKVVTKNLYETVPVSETLALVEEEMYVEDLAVSESVRLVTTHGIIETVSVAESVSVILTLAASRAINGSALNSLELD
jgi:hypothetical protein